MADRSNNNSKIKINSSSSILKFRILGLNKIQKERVVFKIFRLNKVESPTAVMDQSGEW